MMRHFILMASILLLNGVILEQCSADCIDSESVRHAVERQMDRYPSSTLKDIYKSFFQDAFGPGHLIGDDAEAAVSSRSYLMGECRIASVEPDDCEVYEQTGWHGRFYRVSLSVINDGKVPFDVFFDAFMESARMFSLPDIGSWRQEWNAVQKVIDDMDLNLEGYEADRDAINSLLEEGQYVSHHSDVYEKTYHPHYRLIEKSVFESRILPLL